MTSIHDANKALVAPWRDAWASGVAHNVFSETKRLFAPQAKIQFGRPIGLVEGAEEAWQHAYQPLFESMPDLERRDFIVMAGPRWGEGKSGNWVGIAGNVVGTLNNPWLGIPATGRPVFMRYHEYLRIEDGHVVELQGLWDVGQIMLQVGVWPMAPQLGVEWMCPAPADVGGVVHAPFSAKHADNSVQLVWEMLHDLKQGSATTPERGLNGCWHENAQWYGPTGLGTARGHVGITNQILRQFRDGLSHNVRHLDDGVFFGDRNFVAFTGWPSGTATHSGDGFLGVPPTQKSITRASLDFWRVEQNQVRECWVMIDMIDLYAQMGVDVFSRMHALSGRERAA